MKTPVAYVLAVLLHLVVLFGLSVSKPKVALPEPEKKYIEVTLSVPPALPAPPPPPAVPPPPPLPEPSSPLPPPIIEEPLPELNPGPSPTLPQPQTAAAKPEPPSVPALTPAPALQLNTTQGAPENVAPAQRVYFKNRVEPEYPATARRQHLQGSVTLEVFVNEFGNVDKVVVARSSGYPLLDNAAVEAMKESSFNPAYQDKTPMPSHAQITYFFRLE